MTTCQCAARRTFLGDALRLSCAVGCAMQSNTGAASSAPRSLSLYALHTLEQCNVRFWDKGAYLTPGLAELNHVLRDHRTGETAPIDPHLLNQLFAIKEWFKCDVPFHVISGYRSAATNAMLRRNTSQVASKSYHMAGKAIDFRIPGVATTDLRDCAIALKTGGVGYYERSDFIHLDTGPFRQW